MGAPLRALCPDEGFDGDRAWIQRQACSQARSVAKLFARLGVDASNIAGVDLLHQVYTDFAVGERLFRSPSRKSNFF